MFKTLLIAIIKKDLDLAWFILREHFELLNVNKDLLPIISLSLQNYGINKCLAGSFEYFNVIKEIKQFSPLEKRY